MERSRIYDEPISTIEKLLENGRWVSMTVYDVIGVLLNLRAFVDSRQMLKLLPHVKPKYKTETDNSRLGEAASEFRRITDAADLGKIGQGLCRYRFFNQQKNKIP